MFQLKQEICEALKKYFAKFIELGRTWAGDTTQAKSRESLQYLGNLALELLNVVYSGVFSGNIATTEAMVTAIDLIPDAARNKLIELYLMKSTVGAQQRSQELPTVGKNHLKNKEKRERQVAKTMVVVAAASPSGQINYGAKSTATGKELVCGYFCSKQGCKMAKEECSRSHCKPVPSDEEQLTKFFAGGGAGAGLERKKFFK